VVSGAVNIDATREAIAACLRNRITRFIVWYEDLCNHQTRHTLSQIGYVFPSSDVETAFGKSALAPSDVRRIVREAKRAGVPQQLRRDREARVTLNFEPGATL